MAQVAQREAVGRGDHVRGRGVQVGGQAGLPLEQVEPREDGQVAQEVGGPRGHAAREVAQDPLLLLGGHGGRDGELVPQLDHALRLHEEGLPGLGRVVDDAGHGGAGARQHRKDVAVVPDGEVGVAQVGRHALVDDQRLDPRLERPVEAAGPVAKLPPAPGWPAPRWRPRARWPARSGRRAGRIRRAARRAPRGGGGRRRATPGPPGSGRPTGPVPPPPGARAARGRLPWWLAPGWRRGRRSP